MNAILNKNGASVAGAVRWAATQGGGGPNAEASRLALVHRSALPLLVSNPAPRLLAPPSPPPPAPAPQKVYVTMFPCNECAKLMIQAGIREIVFHEDKDQMRGTAAAAAAASPRARPESPSQDGFRSVLPTGGGACASLPARAALQLTEAPAQTHTLLQAGPAVRRLPEAAGAGGGQGAAAPLLPPSHRPPGQRSWQQDRLQQRPPHALGPPPAGGGGSSGSGERDAHPGARLLWQPKHPTMKPRPVRTRGDYSGNKS